MLHFGAISIPVAAQKNVVECGPSYCTIARVTCTDFFHPIMNTLSLAAPLGFCDQRRGLFCLPDLLFGIQWIRH